MVSHAVTRMQETRWAGHGNDWPDGHRQCTKCHAVKPNEAFHKHAQCRGGYNSVCKECRVPVSQAHHKTTSLEVRLFNAAKSRATIKHRDFSLELSDIVIPTHCPVFHTPMVSPSVDRIDSSKGYIKGNVRVISKRANQLKSNATVEEMTLILADLVRLRTAGVCEIL